MPGLAAKSCASETSDFAGTAVFFHDYRVLAEERRSRVKLFGLRLPGEWAARIEADAHALVVLSK